ncbi:chromatin binding protein [Dimargaris cristalligena]|nr:chromatin binding protein [Dimargaris cristalligena]
MNLQLMNPFELQYPTEVEEWLEDSQCKTIRFNTFGTMLALAGTDGRCSILDFDTRSILRYLEGHTATVTSVSWSKNGSYLLSTGTEGRCFFWDLITGEPKHELGIPAGQTPLGVMHPRNSYLAAICVQTQAPFLCDFKGSAARRVPLNLHYRPNDVAEYTRLAKINDSAINEHTINLGKFTYNTLAFDRSGKRLFLGSTKGHLVIYHIRKRVVEVVHQINNSTIRHLRFSRRGTDLLVNSGDRSIRLYIYDSGDKQRQLLKKTYRRLIQSRRAHHATEGRPNSMGRIGASGSTATPSPPNTEPADGSVSSDQSPEEVLEALAQTGPTLTFIHKYQDQVNRVQWNECCFTCDGEHVIGGSAHKAEHNIYVWDKNATNLEKMLTGPKEQLQDLTWHPFRPVAVSVSVFGNIYIWGAKHREDWRNWNAFAPDFKELEENVEYIEREDEFDLVVDDQAVINHIDKGRTKKSQRGGSSASATTPVTVDSESLNEHGHGQADIDVVAVDEDDHAEEIDITTVEKFNPFNDSDFSDSSDDETHSYGPLPAVPGAMVKNEGEEWNEDLRVNISDDSDDEEVMFLPIKLAPTVLDNDVGDDDDDDDGQGDGETTTPGTELNAEAEDEDISVDDVSPYPVTNEGAGEDDDEDEEMQFEPVIQPPMGMVGPRC